MLQCASTISLSDRKTECQAHIAYCMEISCFEKKNCMIEGRVTQYNFERKAALLQKGIASWKSSANEMCLFLSMERCNLRHAAYLKKCCGFWPDFVLILFESASVLALLLTASRAQINGRLNIANLWRSTNSHGWCTQIILIDLLG